ncbi:MAG TPA: tetratricopeptide repeat protein, partial [Accumulibacter sp.]|nr:tetratricopeptide repeat protein [Accumulibacter sp.]
MKPQAVVVLPAANSAGPDSQPVDFDGIYNDLLQPALAEAGLAVRKSRPENDQDEPSHDNFQELLLADLVVVDLTCDCPEAWSALGLCRVLPAHRVIQVQGLSAGRTLLKPDVLRYRLCDGLPDPDTLTTDRAALTALVRSRRDALTSSRINPVFDRLPDLEKALWYSGSRAITNRFSVAFDDWAGRVERAWRQNLPGHLLVLADEMPFRALHAVVRRMAGE